MKTDAFTTLYGERLNDSYDCADRIVLNAYFIFAQSGGGFREWWRLLHGTEDNLTNTALMKYAGRFARRVHAYAQANQIPIRECCGKERKDELSDDLRPKDEKFRGLFAILYSRAPAPVRDVHRSQQGGFHIQTKSPMPWVNHYAFHFLDDEWGHVIIRFCPHPPFNAMIILNGHEYVEREARRQGLSFRKEENCFTELPNADGLTKIADTMISPDGRDVGRLSQVAERWIYTSCLCFALDMAEQERSGFRYQYSVYQAEYSRNYLFRRNHDLETIFNGLIDRTRARLDLRLVKTIFGAQRRRYYRNEKGQLPRMEVSVETPVYDLTIVRIHFGCLTIKMYSKGGRVLRVEVALHNARRLGCGYGIEKFPVIANRLRDILDRFVTVLESVDQPFADTATLEQWPARSTLDGKPVAGVDLNKSRMRAVSEAVLALAIRPKGFRAGDLAERVRAGNDPALKDYTTRQAAYDLRKLRGKQVVGKAPKSLRYTVLPDGLRRLTAWLVLRDQVLAPLLANDGYRRRVPKCHMSPTEVHYDNMQREMQAVFDILNIAA